MSVAIDPGAIAALRRARFRHRVARLDFFDALYQAYIAALVAGIAVVLLSGVAGDKAVKGAELAKVVAHGPAVVGLAIALAVGVGLRSAGRGGPLALEAADVRHLLLAPVSRAAALRGPAMQQLRFGAFAGGAVGAVLGLVAYRVLPGSPIAWVVAGAVDGGLAAMAALGAGLIGSGRRAPRLLANALGLAVVAWSAADLVLSMRTSPLTFLGQLIFWPIHVHLEALIGVAVALALAAVGLSQIGGLSIEAAETRAALVGKLRFAATARDLRTVMVLRRQLSQERSRSRPWLPLARRPGYNVAFAIWKRGWQGILRWPGRRLIRLAVLGGVAGACMHYVWEGTTPLVVVATLALWVAALDAVEPLSQEVDRTDRLSSFPRAEGWVQVRHLAVPCVVMIVVALIGLAVAYALGPASLTLAVGGAVVVPAALTSVAGAAYSVSRETDYTAGAAAMTMPELTGLKTMLRELFPPAIAFIGLLPALLAHRAALHHGLPVEAVINPAVATLLVPVAAFAWLSRRPSRVAGPAPDRLGQK
ncbi:MAG: hypothetical protein ACRD0J_09450 [Acidimicrobiales bacterium]